MPTVNLKWFPAHQDLRPFVFGQVRLRGHLFDRPLRFLVDTGSKQTLISPRHELLLARDDRSAYSRIKFSPAATPIKGITGTAPTKYVRSDGYAAPTGIELATTSGQGQFVGINHLLFVDRSEPIMPRRLRFMGKLLWVRVDRYRMVACEGDDYSIIGWDVLGTCTMHIQGGNPPSGHLEF